jgi:hypothetical protein
MDDRGGHGLKKKKPWSLRLRHGFQKIFGEF